MRRARRRRSPSRRSFSRLSSSWIVRTRDRARDLAGGVAAHAVGDHEEGELLVDEEVVLVVVADVADVGRGEEANGVDRHLIGADHRGMRSVQSTAYEHPAQLARDRGCARKQPPGTRSSSAVRLGSSHIPSATREFVATVRTPMSDPTDPRTPRSRASARGTRGPGHVRARRDQRRRLLWAETHGGTTDERDACFATALLEPLHVWAGEYWRVVDVHVPAHRAGSHPDEQYMLIGWGAPLERALGKARFLLPLSRSPASAAVARASPAASCSARTSRSARRARSSASSARCFAMRRRQLPSLEALLRRPRGPLGLLLQIGIWTAIGCQLHLDNAAHLGGLVVGSFAAAGSSRRLRPRSGWLAFAAGLSARSSSSPRVRGGPRAATPPRHAVYAHRYLTGKSPRRGDATPFHVDVARGTRFATKGCAHGVIMACEVLDDYRKGRVGGGATARAGARRALADLRQACPGVSHTT